MRRALQTAERAFAPLARRLAREAEGGREGEREGEGGREGGREGGHHGSAQGGGGEEGGGREGKRLSRLGVGGVRVVVQALHRERDVGMGRRCDSGRHKFTKKMKKFSLQ